MSGGRRRQGGFTLLELIAAIALLAVGLTVVLSGAGEALKGGVRDELKNHMADMARSLFAENVLGNVPPGRLEGMREGVRWQLDCTLQDTLSGTGIALYRLDLTLSRGVRQEHFSTLRLQRPARKGEP
ncbi:type II secretion system protein [Pseudomonas huaxiensis]|uniref:type II secretion system protein n=1 Tax=Pseudomonas huaxiensis TaxID=2213017 RepID=UPI000DA6701D|nr:prepilin-type N-terminal cleavage/methylation domain-containing protein [Pseudomonas huaxiensis]